MSVRAQLYALLVDMRDGNAATRIAAIGEHLDRLPPAEAEVAARRLLALTKVYAESLDNGLRGTLDALFTRVDEVDASLVN